MIDAMKQALAKFEHLWEIGIDVEYKVELLPEIRILRQAIEQAEKQTHTDHPMRHWDRTCPACVAEAEKQGMSDIGLFTKEALESPSLVVIRSLYNRVTELETQTVKREWVSLTMEDIDNVTGDIGFGYIDVSFAIEARLKELNNG